MNADIQHTHAHTHTHVETSMGFLGRIDGDARGAARAPVVTRERPAVPQTTNGVAVAVAVGRAPSDRWCATVLIALSVGFFAAYAALGLIYIPLDHLAQFDQYDRSVAVLASIWIRLRMAPAFTLAVWLAPLLVAPFIPLDFLTDVFKLLSYGVGVVMVGSLLSDDERVRVGGMLATMPALGYMWHDTILILACCLIVQPDRPWLVLLGPGAAVCGGATTTRRPAALFVALGLLSIAVVLPTAHRFIDTATGEMFIAGYSTDSVFGTMLSYSVILSFTRAYHLVSRSAYRAGRMWASCVGWIGAFAWLLFGTAFVELWVSTAYAFYLAFTSCTRLKPEPESACAKTIRHACRVRWSRSQIPFYVN